MLATKWWSSHERYEKTEHFAKTSDGTKIRYLIWSAGTATKKLVLVHSLAMTQIFGMPQRRR